MKPKSIKEPWLISFSERLRNLKKNTVANRVVYIYEKENASSFRYRVYNVYQIFESNENWAVSYFSQAELLDILDYLPTIRLIIFSRVRWSFEIDFFLGQAKKFQILTAFDVDDLVFDITKIPLIVNTIGHSQPSHYCNSLFSEFSKWWLTGKKCDVTIGTNEYLANMLSTCYNKPSFVINNFLNKQQIEISNSLFEERKKKKSSNEFVMGYFSGSPSHENDFYSVSSELKEFLDKYRDVKLEIVGYLDLPLILRPNFKKRQIKVTPLVDFITLQQKISEVDVNLVPLLENEFTNCKSELKFFEAAIVGTISCTTPTYVYKKNITPEKTGFLCSQGDWFEVLNRLYHNDYDFNIRNNAREYCLKHYSAEHQQIKISDVFEKICQISP